MAFVMGCVALLSLGASFVDTQVAVVGSGTLSKFKGHLRCESLHSLHKCEDGGVVNSGSYVEAKTADGGHKVVIADSDFCIGIEVDELEELEMGMCENPPQWGALLCAGGAVVLTVLFTACCTCCLVAF